MLSRGDSIYYNNYVAAQLSKECNPNLIVDLTLLLLPGYSPEYHLQHLLLAVGNTMIYKLHRWLSDFPESKSANRVEPLGRPDYWDQDLNKVGLALLDCVI